jgi:type I restriction enzyme S subunit
MSKWQSVSDFVNFSTKGITPQYVEYSSIIVLNQKCIRNGTINYSFSQFTDDTKQIQQSKFVQKGDILVNSTGTGTAGRCAFVTDLPENHKLIVDSHILILRCNTFYEAQCLSYSLFSFEKTLMSFMTGSSGQSELDKVVLMNLKTKIPTDKTTQQKIASVLSALDSKIELNNRINAELEAMAKTLYDYWFVQFDFPFDFAQSKPNANGKPYKSSGGKMVWNEELKREIPEGWEVKLFSEWINNDKSGDWGKEQIEGNYTEKVYCIRGADINGLNGQGELKTPERYILEKNLHKTLDPADLIVEISGGSPTQSTGRLAFITEDTLTRFDAPIICSNFCKAVTLKNKKQLYNFVYHWKSIYDAGVLFGYEGKTSGIKNLLFESFVSSHYTVVPEMSATNKFYDFMEQLESKKQKNLKENQKLTELRDWLLPMLMNGQVKVMDEMENELSMAAEPKIEYGK